MRGQTFTTILRDSHRTYPRYVQYKGVFLFDCSDATDCYLELEQYKEKVSLY